MDRHKKNTGLWSCLPAGIIIVTFIGFIAASGVLAQQISSGNGNRFSEAFFGQDLYFFNLLSGYPYNHSLFPTYNGFFSPSLLSFSGSGSGSGSRGLESYGNYANGGVYDPYYSIFSQTPYGNSLPPASFYSTGSLDGRLDAGVYIAPSYSWPGAVLSSPWTLDPGFFPPGLGPGVTGIYGPIYGRYPVPPGGPAIPSPSDYCDPASAPAEFAGKWQSRQLTDESGDMLKGDLRIDKISSQKIVRMAGSSLPLVEGPLSQFQYTRTQGKAPISFKALFYRGYSAEFTGTADNRLCCRNLMCFWAGTFEVEGEYVIKDNLGQTADEGTFSLKRPAGSSTPKPELDEAIKKRSKPVKEARKVLSLATGAAGLIYGGTAINYLNAGHMFIYDPTFGKSVDLGNPGYECNAVTTGADGLIYIGGSARNSSPDECTVVGYANLAVYDPNKPWNPGQGPEANPRDFGQAVGFSGEVVGCPIVVHDLAAAPDGKIYGCTGYRDGIDGEYYAHLFVYDPQTSTIEDLGQPIPNQSSITRLAVTPAGIIYGIILAPRTGNSHPPGKFFSYNPTLKSFTIIDTPSAIEGIIALTVGKDGLLYIAGGADDSDIFTYDPDSEAFDYKGPLGEGAKVLRMHCSKYGIIYIGCGGNGYLVRYDPQSPWGEQQASSSQDAPEVNPEMFQGTGGVNALAENSRGVIYFGARGARLYSHMGWELSQHIDSHCMHIASIEMFLHGNDEIMGAGAKIMVVDDEGNPVRGATVVGNWTGISIGDNFDGYTDGNGVADIPCPRISHGLEGEFCFEVTGITRYKDWVYSEWIYSPEANIVNSACIHTSARIVDTTAGECKSEGLDGAGIVEAADEISVEYHQGRLYVTHINAVYNCCLDRVRVIMGLEGKLIKLMEWEEADTPCDCTCPVDVTTLIERLEPGIYTIRVYQGDVQVGEIENVAI